MIEHANDPLSFADLMRFTREVQDAFGEAKPGEPLWSEELIAERREEAKRNETKY